MKKLLLWLLLFFGVSMSHTSFADLYYFDNFSDDTFLDRWNCSFSNGNNLFLANNSLVFNSTLAYKGCWYKHPFIINESAGFFFKAKNCHACIGSPDTWEYFFIYFPDYGLNPVNFADGKNSTELRYFVPISASLYNVSYILPLWNTKFLNNKWYSVDAFLNLSANFFSVNHSNSSLNDYKFFKNFKPNGLVDKTGYFFVQMPQESLFYLDYFCIATEEKECVSRKNNLIVVFKNLSGVAKTNFNPFYEKFKVVVNASHDSVCTVKSSNWRNIVYEKNDSFTVCLTGCDKQSFFVNVTGLSLGSTNQDSVVIEACSIEKTRQVFNISICGSKSRVLNFPLCSSYGTSHRKYISSNCNNKNYVWFNISSFGLEGTENSPLLITKIVLSKRQVTGKKDLVFNSSNGLFYGETIYRDSGSEPNPFGANYYANFTVNCTDAVRELNNFSTTRLTFFEKPIIFFNQISFGGDYRSGGFLVNLSQNNTFPFVSPYDNEVFWYFSINSFLDIYPYSKMIISVFDREKDVFDNVSVLGMGSTSVFVFDFTYNISQSPFNVSVWTKDFFNNTASDSVLFGYCLEDWHSVLVNGSCNGTFVNQRKFYFDLSGCGTKNVFPADNNTVNNSFLCCFPSWKDYSFNLSCNGTFFEMKKFYWLNTTCNCSDVEFLGYNCTVPYDNNSLIKTVDCSLPETVLQVGHCPENLQGIASLFLFLVLAMFLIVIGFVFRLGIVGFFGSLILLFSSWFLAGCSSLMAYVVAFVSIALFVVFAFVVPNWRVE